MRARDAASGTDASKYDAMPYRRIRTPTVLQMEATECGAAALAIILAWHGRHVSLEQLRHACGVSRDGSNAANMLKAARSFGLNAKGYKKEPKDLRSVALPLIIFWNFNHFLVVEGFDKDRVYLNDPATGPRTVSYEEFDRSFTGVALLFEKGPAFVQGGKRPSPWRSLLKRFSGNRPALVFLTVCTLLLVVPGLISPVFSRVFVDEIAIANNQAWLRPLLGLMVATAVLIAGLTFLQSVALLKLQARLGIGSSGRFVWHVFQLPIEFFTQRYAGDVIQRIEANQQVAKLLSSGLSSNIVNLMMVVFYAALMLSYDVWLSTVVILTAIGELMVFRWVTRYRADENRRLAQEHGKFIAVTMTGIQMVETLKATGSEMGFFSRWAGHQAKLMNSTRRFAESSNWLSGAPALLGAASTACILGFGGIRVMDGALTIGMFMAFQALIGSFNAPIQGLLGLSDSVQNIQGSLARLDDVMEYPKDPTIENAPANTLAHIEGEKLEGAIELRDITFGYSRLAAPIIRNFSLKVEPGQRIALVGASGSGKSTIAKLAAGLFYPWEGTVLLDGRPRADIPRDLIAHSVAMVDQDIMLFQGTIKENLSLWDETAKERDLVRAARDAQIHDVIMDRPGAYDLQLEEGGTNLSVGQRQRLELARALSGNPRLLILDEASSALDTQTETAIFDNLRKRGCAMLIVAHRLSTIRDCDEIIVLRGGKVVQRGNHDNLIGQPGLYRDLILAE